MKKNFQKEKEKLEDQLYEEIDFNKSHKDIIRHLEAALQDSKDEIAELKETMKKMNNLLKDKDEVLEEAEKHTLELNRLVEDREKIKIAEKEAEIQHKSERITQLEKELEELKTKLVESN